MMLGRVFDPLTQMWVAPGLVPIAAEVMQPLLDPRATAVDLFAVLSTRDCGDRPAE